MFLLFWICTILLAVVVIADNAGIPSGRAAIVLVVIDLILLGLHVFGGPR